MDTRCSHVMASLALRVFVLSLIGCATNLWAHEPLRFRAHVVNAESEFCSCAAIDVNGDGRLDIVSGGWWYANPSGDRASDGKPQSANVWTRHKLRDVERIGTRFDDYSNLTLDVDGDADLDLISVNYRSKSLYWVRNPGVTQANSLWDRVPIDTPGPSETGRLVDVDRDGQLDVLPNGTTFAAWYSFSRPVSKSATSSEVLWQKHELPSQLAGHGIGAGDINGDGRIDLVNTTGWAEAPEDPRTGRWLWHAEYRLPRDGSVPILVEDVDGDGDADLIWGRGHNVGVYWTEQRRSSIAKEKTPHPDNAIDETLNVLRGQTTWVTHAIDTSWSCAHAPLWADLDGDGISELVVGKRFQGHEGKDPGENEPLGVFSYQFDKQQRTWHRRTISLHPLCGLDLDPKCVDIDGDGDLDIIAPARSGLVLLENLRIVAAGTAQNIPDQALASSQLPLPEGIVHNDFTILRSSHGDQVSDKPLATQLDMGDRRSQIMRQMELVMGELPTSQQRVPLDVQVERVEAADKYTRIKLSYAAEPGDRVPAWLLIPDGLTSAAPGMLCLHPTHYELGKDQLLGLGGKPSRFYAHELAQRGMVCLVPDYPGFGEYKWELADHEQYASTTMKAIWNNLRGIDLLESLPCVKVDSIGCLGHSLGGHNALYTAAFDVRVRAVMSSCGFNTFADYYGGNLKGWTSKVYMPRIASQYGSDPQRLPFDFPEVLAAIAPRPLLVNAPLHDANFAVEGVRKCEAAVSTVYKLLGKQDNMTFLYPDAEHDFPDDIRQQTYDWFAKQFK
jgi:dienelactone hydrolase